jgi:ribonuclease HII
LIYAGIDEAGYGPFFGPLTVGRAVLSIPKLPADAPLPDLWARLNKAVCRRLTGRAGRIVVNDSKKLKTKAAGIKHLEIGCLAFAGLRETDGQPQPTPTDVGTWLDSLGETSHRDADLPTWYREEHVGPWDVLPAAADAGELAVARGLLSQTCRRIGVGVTDLGGAVVFENRFNAMVEATRSKAAVSFTSVAGHLAAVWERHAAQTPTVVVDRQSGRMRYREPLARAFAEAAVDVLEETAERSTYRITADGGRAMRVVFQTSAEERHLPVALASMLAKYHRELLMGRFQRYWSDRCPDIAPTAGYGSDAKRFWQQLEPRLKRWDISPRQIRRQA